MRAPRSGTAVIDLTPGPVKEWAIQTFGTADKLFLSVLVLVVIGVIAAVAAIWERVARPDRHAGDLAGGGGRLCRGAVPRRSAVDRHHPDAGRRGVRHRRAAPADLGTGPRRPRDRRDARPPARTPAGGCRW